MAHGLGPPGHHLGLYLLRAVIIALVSLLTRDIAPTKGLLLLGSTAFFVAMLPFFIPVKEKT
jgi:hypothetical protein